MSLRRHTIWNLIGNGLPLAVGIFFIPYTLRQLGYEAFGVLTLIWSLIGYFSLFDLGIGRALTYEIAGLMKAGKKNDVPNAFLVGLSLTALTGLLGGLCIYLIAPPLTASWLNIVSEWQQDAQLAFQIAGLGIIFTTVTSGMRGTQEALGDFRLANINKLILGSAMFLMPAVAIWLHGPHLWVIAAYLVLARALVFLINCVQLKWLFFNRPQLGKSIDFFKSLLSFGGWVSVSGVISPLMVYGDRFFVGAIAGPALLPIYAIPQEALQRLLILPASFTNALLPKIVGLNGQQLKSQYSTSFKHTAWIMLLVCCGACAIAYPGLRIWISPDFASSAMPIVLILSVGIWLNSMASIPYTFIHGVGNAKITAYIHLGELGVYFILLYVLVKHFGLPGAALAWTLRVGIDLVLLQIAVKGCFIEKGDRN